MGVIELRLKVDEIGGLASAAKDAVIARRLFGTPHQLEDPRIFESSAIDGLQLSTKGEFISSAPLTFATLSLFSVIRRV